MRGALGESAARPIVVEIQTDYDPVEADGQYLPGDFQMRTETRRSREGRDLAQRFWYSVESQPDSFALVYDGGRLVRGEYFDANSTLAMVYQFETDAEGRRSIERYQSPEGELLGSTVYRYRDGREWARETAGPEGVVSARYETGYTESGFVAWTDYIAESDTSRTEYEYVDFDSERNWTVRVARNASDGSAWQVSVRELRYE